MTATRTKHPFNVVGATSAAPNRGTDAPHASGGITGRDRRPTPGKHDSWSTSANCHVAQVLGNDVCRSLRHVQTDDLLCHGAWRGLKWRQSR